MRNTKDVYLLTGSNIEPRKSYLMIASEKICEHIGELVGQSQIYESDPWGFDAEMAFLNQVLLIQTELSAENVLIEIMEIEKSMGRKRIDENYSSRTIDIDILYFDREVIHQDNLIIPHPRLHKRRFTLLPLVDIDRNFKHPVFQLTNNELLEMCEDPGKVWIY